MSALEIRVMALADYDEVMDLLRGTEGVRLREADSREALGRYLERNPGLSFVACEGARIVGCVMCGHDGRRGYLQHLVVSLDHRRRGIGSALVEACLAKLETLGILKTHIDVLVENVPAQEFWGRCGWQQRKDVVRFSFVRSTDQNV